MEKFLMNIFMLAVQSVLSYLVIRYLFGLDNDSLAMSLAWIFAVLWQKADAIHETLKEMNGDAKR